MAKLIHSDSSARVHISILSELETEKGTSLNIFRTAYFEQCNQNKDDSDYLSRKIDLGHTAEICSMIHAGQQKGLMTQVKTYDFKNIKDLDKILKQKLENQVSLLHDTKTLENSQLQKSS